MKYIYNDFDNYTYDFLSRDGDNVKIKIKETGETGYIFAERIHDYGEGRKRIWENFSAYPDVEKGEIVHISGRTDKRLFVIAQSGQVGWIPCDVVGE